MLMETVGEASPTGYDEHGDTIVVDTSAVRKKRSHDQAFAQDDKHAGGTQSRRERKSGSVMATQPTSENSQTVEEEIDEKEKTMSINEDTKEEAASLSAVPPDPLVHVHVGPHNNLYTIRQSSLSKSQYLTSLVITRPYTPFTFIIDLSFMPIEPKDFE